MAAGPRMPVYIETGSKKTFASAVEWPGWSRGGPDESAALQALIDYGPRYASVIETTGIRFSAPPDSKTLRIDGRLQGNSSTDFGVPTLAHTSDRQEPTSTELDRLVSLLVACWNAFTGAAKSAGRKSLRTGPRGGGRDIARMWSHVLEADMSYLAQVGGRFRVASKDLSKEWDHVHDAFKAALIDRIRGELPDKGPRGGQRWPPRYAIRRSAWHALDHAWEIEDRLRPAP